MDFISKKLCNYPKDENIAIPSLHIMYVIYYYYYKWCTCVDINYGNHAFNLMKANVMTVVSLEKLRSKV